MRRSSHGRQPPVARAEQVHQRRHEQRADDERVEEAPRREADAEQLDHAVAAEDEGAGRRRP